MIQNTEQVKHVVDTLSISAIVLAWMNTLSTAFTLLSTILAALWAAVRLYETKTVQDWVKKRRKK